MDELDPLATSVVSQFAHPDVMSESRHFHAYTGDQDVHRYAGLAGQTYENEAKSQYPQGDYTGSRKEVERRVFERARELHIQAMSQSMQKAPGRWQQWSVERMPILGTLTGAVAGFSDRERMAEAQQKMNTGQADASHYYNVAQALAKQQNLAQRSTGRKIVDVATQFPAMATEWALSGGTAPAAEGAGIGARMLQQGAGTVLRQAPTMPFRVAGPAAQAMTPQPSLTGQGVQFKDPESFGNAFGHAIASDVIERGVFGTLDPLSVAAGRSYAGRVASLLAAGELSEDAKKLATAAPEGGPMWRLATAKTSEERLQALQDAGIQTAAAGLFEAGMHGLAHARGGGKVDLDKAAEVGVNEFVKDAVEKEKQGLRPNPDLEKIFGGDHVQPGVQQQTTPGAPGTAPGAGSQGIPAHEATGSAQGPGEPPPPDEANAPAGAKDRGQPGVEGKKVFIPEAGGWIDRETAGRIAGELPGAEGTPNRPAPAAAPEPAAPGSEGRPEPATAQGLPTSPADLLRPNQALEDVFADQRTEGQKQLEEEQAQRQADMQRRGLKPSDIAAAVQGKPEMRPNAELERIIQENNPPEGVLGSTGAMGIGLHNALYDHLSTTFNNVRNNLKELAGEMGPRTTAADRESGEAMARFNAAPVYAREAAPVYIDKVMGPDATKTDRLLAGAVITERRLRHIKDVYTQQGEVDKANDVKTIVGHPDSPLKDEATYQQALASPKMQGILGRWKQEFVPIMESNFRRAQGLEETDPINSPTQIPGEPVNLKAVRPGDPVTGSTVAFGEFRGNLKNLKLRKLPFSETATGASDAYDIDLGAIVENSLARGTGLAAKAEMFRTMEANGLGKWNRAGQQIDGFKEVPFTRPPKGTQKADPGDVFYVRNEAYPELRQALGVDQPFKTPVVTSAMNALTKAALASTAEATYHAKNILTFLTKPGVSPVDFLKNAYGVMTKDPGMAERMVELARIGAAKEAGFESPTPLATHPLNPLHWMSNFLNVLDRSMRLTAEDAFNRLAKRPDKFGRVLGTETNKRNFINQLGQYNKKAQNKLVVLLRDIGVGPFATAGSNYYMQGLRSVTMNPGAKAASPAGAVALRAEMLAKTVGVVASTALANYLMWKRPDGDENTPLGAIKVGEKDGRTSYVDVTGLIGLTRGLRQLGILSILEGKRKGADTAKVEDKGVQNAIISMLHPAMGPGFQFAYMAGTGRNTIGMQVAKQAKPGHMQSWENLQAALRNANPLYAALTGAERPEENVPASERINKLAGPFGVKFRGPSDERGLAQLMDKASKGDEAATETIKRLQLSPDRQRELVGKFRLEQTYEKRGLTKTAAQARVWGRAGDINERKPAKPKGRHLIPTGSE